MLVAQVACYRDAIQTGVLAVAINFGGGFDGREHRARDAEVLQHIRIPVKGFQVHHEGAGGIGDIGHMHTALGAAGKVPGHPGIDVAEENFPLLSFFADAGDVVQDPFCFHTGEVGRQGQTNLGGVFVLTAFFGEFVADQVSAGILPDDGVVNGFASGFFPDNGGFALVGDADRGDFLDIDVEFFQSAFDNVLSSLPNLKGIVFYPTGFRVNLFVFFLIIAYYCALVVKNHKAGAGSTLINCSYVLCHCFSFLD